jgi:hypothetical protein
MKRIAFTILTISLAIVFAMAQEQGAGPRSKPGEMVAGTVTVVGNDSVTVAPRDGGNPVVVRVGDDTRISKDRQPVKVSDIKIGDMVLAHGPLDGSTMQARMLTVLDPEMAQRVRDGMGVIVGTGDDRAHFKAEDWGKTFVAGRVKAIHETTLTIARQEQQTLNVEVDENTSFKKGREAVTLADVKIDDFVFGPGELKNGVFVAKELRVGGQRMLTGGPGPAAGQGQTESPKTPVTPKN